MPFLWQPCILPLSSRPVKCFRKLSSTNLAASIPSIVVDDFGRGTHSTLYSPRLQPPEPPYFSKGKSGHKPALSRLTRSSQNPVYTGLQPMFQSPHHCLTGFRVESFFWKPQTQFEVRFDGFNRFDGRTSSTASARRARLAADGQHGPFYLDTTEKCDPQSAR